MNYRYINLYSYIFSFSIFKHSFCRIFEPQVEEENIQGANSKVSRKGHSMFYFHTSFKTTTEVLSLVESFSVLCILYDTCIDFLYKSISKSCLPS